MCGHGIILVVVYHLFFIVEPRFALKSVSIDFMMASMTFFSVSNILLLLHMLSSVIQGMGSDLTGSHIRDIRDSRIPNPRIKNIHCCR
jgi:hypothetical protein